MFLHFFKDLLGNKQDKEAKLWALRAKKSFRGPYVGHA
jgi:hypothetical protein